MQIKVSFAISGGTAESDALPLLTLEIDAQPSIETLGLGQDLPMEVFTDGVRIQSSNRQTVPLFKLESGDVFAATLNAAVPRFEETAPKRGRGSRVE